MNCWGLWFETFVSREGFIVKLFLISIWLNPSRPNTCTPNYIGCCSCVLVTLNRIKITTKPWFRSSSPCPTEPREVIIFVENHYSAHWSTGGGTKHHSLFCSSTNTTTLALIDLGHKVVLYTRVLETQAVPNMARSRNHQPNSSRCD